MIGATRRIFDEAMSLPEPERRTLAEALMDSVTSEQEIAVEWRDELLRRVEEVRTGGVTPVPWSEVRRQLRGGERES